MARLDIMQLECTLNPEGCMKKRSEACISVMVRFRHTAPRTSTFVEVEEKYRIDRARGYEAADSASSCLNLQIVI